MRLTIAGTVTTADGLARGAGLRDPDDPGATIRPLLASACPGDNFDRHQPSFIPVDVDHDRQWIGEVVHLERRHGVIHAVAVIDAPDGFAADGPWWLSAEAVGHAAPGSAVLDGIELRSVSLTTAPAGLGLHPVRFLTGDLRRSDHRAQWAPNRVAPAVTRAIARQAARHVGAPLVIAEVDQPVETRTGTGRPPGVGPIEHRPAAIVAVR